MKPEHELTSIIYLDPFCSRNRILVEGEYKEEDGIGGLRNLVLWFSSNDCRFHLKESIL